MATGQDLRNGYRPNFTDLSDLTDSAAIGLHFVDAAGIIVWANAADYGLLGYCRDEYVGHHISEFHADQAAIADILRRLSAGEALNRHEARLRCRDGSERLVEITSSARFIAHAGGRRFAHTRCFTQDVTERRRVEQAKDLLVLAGQALAQSLDVAETLRMLGRLTVPGFADWYAVHLRNERGDVEPVHIAHGDPKRLQLAWDAISRWPLRPEDPHGPALAIRTGRSSLISDIAPDYLERIARDPEHRRLLLGAGIRSAMVVPMTHGNVTIGAMTFITTTPARAYGTQELRVGEALASRAAMAISNARLHQEATSAQRAAQVAAERLSVLARASEAIAASLEPDEALIALARFAVTSLADYCITYRKDVDGRIRRVGLAHARREGQSAVEKLAQAGLPELTDPSGVGAVIRTGRAVLARDVDQEMTDAHAKNARHLAALRELQPCSSMIVPLEARGHTLGAVAFVATSHSNRRYDEADLDLAQELGRRVGLLVDNARLFSEARAASQAREDMLAIVSHELRSPLNTIVSASLLLDRDLTPEVRAATQAGVRRAAYQMSRLLEDLLDMTRIEQGRLTISREPLDLAALITDTLSIYQAVAHERSVALVQHLPRSPAASTGDRGRLGQALANLVDNALKVTPDGGEVRVTLTPGNDHWLISVADTGPGIPAEDLPHLFDRFWRSDNAGPHGLGLGLAIAKGILEAHGGTIEVDRAAVPGARFKLVLPLDPSVGSTAGP